MKNHILLVTCQDSKGLISKICSVVFQHGLNIIVMKEFVEESSNIFFMRSELSGDLDKDKLFEELAVILPEGADLVINPKDKKDIVLLVTKEHHCLSDLLSKHHFNELNAKVHAVIGNHQDLQNFTERYDVPFIFLSHENKTKEQYELELYEAIIPFNPDYLVLAKFMRILSPDFVAKFSNKIINIHHSFLPAFIGANPYKQAYERGVKLIGATAHFVTNDLDDGPIIVQEVTSVDHTFSVKLMVQEGHKTEVSVLSNALSRLFEDRVFVFENKTIIFN